jgi:hypothetical protein
MFLTNGWTVDQIDYRINTIRFVAST